MLRLVQVSVTIDMFHLGMFLSLSWVTRCDEFLFEMVVIMVAFAGILLEHQSMLRINSTLMAKDVFSYD